MDEAVTIIDLLRHGEPEGGHRYRGRLDDPLSLRGWAQMRAVIGERCPWEVVISSPLRRCLAFAQELAARCRLRLEIEPDFREICFGVWEGCTPVDILADTPQALADFWRDPLSHPPPGGESLAACQTRVEAAWKALLERHAGRHVLLIGHGGVVRLVISHILAMSLNHIWRLEVPYASLSRIRVHGRGADAQPVLVFHSGPLPEPGQTD